MSKFNTPAGPAISANLAGGDAYESSYELQLTVLLLTTFLKDKYYETEKETLKRLVNLIHAVDPVFAAKALIYARTVYGMRSITHAGASMLGIYASGKPWARSFYNKIIYRLDDMTEIASYHFAHKEKLSKAMQKGFADAFSRFSAYQIAKYRGEGKGVKLVDMVNLCHPQPSIESYDNNEGNAEALRDLVKDSLKNTETWESLISAAGQKGSDQTKDAVWSRLLREKRLGYMALLRNLRNIIQDAPGAVPLAVESLTSETFIKKSLILPFSYKTAFHEIDKLPDTSITRIVRVAINKALDISVNNVPKFTGETLVVLDTSGSMKDNKVQDIGALFAAVIAKANNADFMTFDNTARYVSLSHADSTMTMANNIPFNGMATNFHSIFQVANMRYDRIIILSDMQGWVGQHTPQMTFNSYRLHFRANPFVYSFDLAGYGSTQFPEKKIFCMAGFSDKVFSTMSLFEADKDALLNTIKAVEL